VPTEIAAFGKLEKEFRARDAQLLGASIDSEYVHLAWRREKEELRNLPSRCSRTSSASSAGALGILDPEAGVAQRATFIVDPHGVIRFVYVTDLNVGRSPEGSAARADALQTDELCPATGRRAKTRSRRPEVNTLEGIREALPG